MLHVDVARGRLRPLIKSTTTISRPSDNRPILRNLLLTATEDKLEVSATNMAVSLWLRIPVGDDLTVTETGKVVVPAQDLLRVLEVGAGDRVEIEDVSNRCIARCGGSKFSMVVEDSRDFPSVSRFSDRKPYVRVPGKLFTELLGRSLYCAHNERSFFLMHGLLAKVEDGHVSFVATNGQRLGVCRGAYTETSDPDWNPRDEIVIPAVGAAALQKVVGREKELVDIQWMARALNVRGPHGEVSVLSLNGRFPDYRRGIPTNSKTITFDRENLIKLLRQTQVFKDASTTLVAAEFTSDKLRLRTLSPEVGEAEVAIDITWGHDPITLVLNPQFMLHSARAMDSECLDFEIENEMTQTLMRERRTDSVESFCVYAVARQ